MKTKIFYFLILSISIFIAACGNKAKENKAAGKTNPAVQNKITQQQQYNNYLTAQDVERVSGIKNVIFISKSSIPGAGGDLNFAAEDSNLIIMIQITDQNNYESYKSYYFKSAIDGLGDEAMKGATSSALPDNIVVFRKSGKCIALTVFMSSNNFKKNMLTLDQLIALGKIVSERM